MSEKKDYRKILGNLQTREEVMEKIQLDDEMYRVFEELSEEMQEEVIAFCMGNWGIKTTYDPVFKYIFNPELHPERLSEFLSLVLKEEVEVIRALPNESDRMSDQGTLLIMDILVKLKSGALANIEIQKIGYTFPGQRCACYSADLLMRQFARVRNEKKGNFSYRDMKRVYSIVLIEDSSSEYHRISEYYIHRASQKFDTGLELDLLQEYIIIPLDIFKEKSHNELNKLEAWLYFLCSDNPKDISRIVEKYPQFKQIYAELIEFRYHPKELIDMYREALRLADENTIRYMVEEQQKKLRENEEELLKQEKELQKAAEELERKNKEIERLRALLGET